MRAENWIKWDLSSREDYATKWFLSHYSDKASAYGFLLWLAETLYHSNDGCVPESEIFYEGFANEIGWSKDSTCLALARLCQANLFFAKGGFIYSKRVLREVEERKTLSVKRSNSGKLGGIARATNANESKHLLANAKQIVAKSSRGEEKRVDKIRVDKKYKIFTESDFKFCELWGEKSKQYLKKWVEYKAASSHPKLLASYQEEINQFEKAPREYARLVDRAITQGWKGLNAQIPFEAPQTQKKTTFEHNLDVLKFFTEKETDYENGRNGANTNENDFILPDIEVE